MKTLFLDTNIILRYLLRDHEGMYHAAVNVFEQAEHGEFVLYIEPMVLAECIYVLTGPVYVRNRSDVARALAEVLLLEGIMCEDKDRLTESLTMYAEQNVDFTDAYLVCRSRDAEAGIVSFDRDFLRLGSSVHIPDVETLSYKNGEERRHPPSAKGDSI
ncbi:PIN domain-containing protein [Alicyclobacillus macrosporangiidus]|uniref:Ribonuclease VapC n=1 Tax=Alicyclobacillus macrosporangiidus TaxID=392015 RepID=A0A1I7KE44_9BACL|nr:PIN domain-containing protein [Alicyclobacillus macrosporangiidus]SFU95665.1 Predicted nucleic acid-binding protein, contains PIN domain [Alicyclobacillus macrosporangiidus]